MTFQDFNFNEQLTEGITSMGYTTPTPIQGMAIPIILEGKDIIACAQTGTGKTAAFGLPLLQLVESENKYPQALIVCPTRELCLQICNDLQDLKKYSWW